MDEPAATIRLRSSAGGKPELAEDPPRLRFNLSHSGCLVLVAVAAARDVGVDVEWIDPRRDVTRLAARVLDAAAAASVRAAPPNERAVGFHRAWARREAAAKCHGVGLRGRSPGTPVAVVTLDVGAGFAAAVAAAGETLPPVRLLAASAAPQASG